MAVTSCFPHLLMSAVVAAGVAGCAGIAESRDSQIKRHVVRFDPGPRRPEVQVKHAMTTDTLACIPTGWPLDHPSRRVISPFGPRGRRMHRGIDLKAPYGSPVRATAEGVVTRAGTMNGYGRIVVIDHGNDYETAYAHLKADSVRVGDLVQRGSAIGLLGNTGRTTTHHVHYEVRCGGECIDPFPYLIGEPTGPAWMEHARN
ncbi:MAG: M23 family metallopeptidase [Candidatus Hydrogenedentota bacterium]